MPKPIKRLKGLKEKHWLLLPFLLGFLVMDVP